MTSDSLGVFAIVFTPSNISKCFSGSADEMPHFCSAPETNVQFRLEAFNTLNHPMFGNPGQLNFTTSGFSKITTERTNNGNTGARIVQLALKLFF